MASFAILFRRIIPATSKNRLFGIFLIGRPAHHPPWHDNPFPPPPAGVRGKRGPPSGGGRSRRAGPPGRTGRTRSAPTRGRRFGNTRSAARGRTARRGEGP